jgi:hypothetical protein
VFWIRPMTRSFTRGSAVVTAAFALFALAAAASGEIPKKINYQGKLTDPSGVPLSGSHSMVFSIYEAADGGSPLWSETKTAEADSDGIFSTVLGSVNSLEVDFTGPCWLEIEVDGETLSPRREVVSVPFAYQAEHAGSATNAAEAANAVALGGRPAEAFADSSVDGHSLDAADGDPEDAVYVDGYGRVGVGTSTPATFLDVRTFGSAEGGVSPYGEVLGHFKISGSDAHSAISIDAQTGKDAILYFAQTGASMWDLRNDTDIGDKFQLRWHRAGTNKVVTVDSTGYVGITTTTPNGPLHIQSNLSINSGTRLTDRVAPLVVGDGDGANPCILIDGNQIEQADTTDLVYINYNSPADIALAQGGGNVGIGTTTPDTKLEVAGQVKISSGASASGLWLTSGYEGIGTSTPNGPLHVESDITITSGTNLADRVAPVVVGDGDGSTACLLIDGNQIEQSDASSVLHLNYTSPAKVSLGVGGGNVGIGTTNPSAKLEVAGQMKITGGSPGAGKVLSSDAGGLASWQAMDVEYMVNPADNALARLSGGDLAQGYYEGYYLMYANVMPAKASLAIPIHVQSRIGGVTQRIKSLKVYYQACTGNKIDATRVKMMDNAGGDIAVIDDASDRTSTSWASYTLTDPSPDPITGVVTVWLDIDFADASCFMLQSIILTTGP